MKYDNVIYINQREISINSPAYFIAELAANHDGSLERLKELIWLAKEAGADCVKLQHFKAEKLVSDYGFKILKTKLGHQESWKKSTYEIYKMNETKREWTKELSQTAKRVKIDLMTSPYNYETINQLDEYFCAYKIGSGDITWIDFIRSVAKKKKPVILATGASNIQDVKRAVSAILEFNRKIILLQCNTNYTAKKENFRYINLNVLKTFQQIYPQLIIGLSDHTKSYSTVLGAIALGARVIEKHFTDDSNREGPDHSFSTTPKEWKEMVERSRELELAMGNGIKKIEKNELETIIVQRRCLRFKDNLKKGKVIRRNNLVYLRPAPPRSFEPFRANEVIGKKVNKSKVAGDALYLIDLQSQ